MCRRCCAQDGEDVSLYHHSDAHEIEGINNRVQLADMERILCRRIIKKLMLDYGVTFIDPKNAYISERAINRARHGDLSECHYRRRNGNRRRLCYRSGTRITNSRIGHGVEILDNCVITDSEVGNQLHRRTDGTLARTRENGRKIKGRKLRRTQKNDSRHAVQKPAI